MSLGFEQSGFDIAAAVDIDPVHCAVHKFNFPYSQTISLPVESLSGEQILKSMHRHPSAVVDCVIGGAPCQGFSVMGHRSLDDPRNKLAKEFLRLIVELQARTFVFENVKGLTVGAHSSLLEELVQEFSEFGYQVRTPWKVLNCGHYQTPQNRERLILLGARAGENLPEYPDPLCQIPGLKTHNGPLISNLPMGPSCSDALRDLPDAEIYDELFRNDTVISEAYSFPSVPLSPYAADLRCTNDKSWHYGYERFWSQKDLTSSARTDHSVISRRRFRDTPPGFTEPISRFYKLNKNGVSNTLRAGTDGSRGAHTSPRPIHYEHNRCITVREMARLHGFPDWFRFNATKWHGARQIGNAVPPPLARAVAAKVMSSLGVLPSPPLEAIDLGDPRLLSLNPTTAAHYFGVVPRVSRRDQKSGAKKRKQSDIERNRITKIRLHA